MADHQIQLWTDWKIIQEIGAGSFGKVYEIHRQNGIHLEKAALKVIRIPSSPAELLQLRSEGLQAERTEEYLAKHVDEIRNEIGVMQKFIGYSNIVSYEDYLINRHADDVGWDILIRMELLTPLDKYTASHPMTEKLVLKVGMDISQALVILHGGGIIHRDIKPQNIFINDRGFFKLGDFGISRALPRTGGVMSFKGTLAYMAPETFAMRGTDERSDIYALALVLYRCLNGGREPFLKTSGFTPEQKDEAQLRRLRGARLPLPEYGSGSIAAVLARALDPDPGKRYQTADQFYKALAIVAAGKAQGRNNIPSPPPGSAGGTSTALPRMNWGGAGAAGIGRRAAVRSGSGAGTRGTGGRPQARPLHPSNGTGTNHAPAYAYTRGTRSAAGKAYAQSAADNKRKRILLAVAVAAIGILAYFAAWSIFNASYTSAKRAQGQTVDSAEDIKNSFGSYADSSADREVIRYAGEDAGDALVFADPALEGALREALSIVDRPITIGDAVNVFKLELSGELKGEDGKITDLAGLSAFENLEELDLSSNLIQDLDELEGMENLSYLDLGSNRITDLSPLRNLRSLTYLDLLDNEIVDMTPLSGMSQLELLDLSGNLLTGLDGFEGLSAMQFALFNRNEISDLRPLSSVPGMLYLSLSENRIENIRPLKNLTHLLGLSLYGNQIEDVSPLKNMKDLELLVLDDNRIRDIGVVKDLPGLTEISVCGNPIENQDLLHELPDSVTVYAD